MFERFRTNFGRYTVTLLVEAQLAHDENRVYQVIDDMVLVNLGNDSFYSHRHVMSSHKIERPKI